MATTDKDSKKDESVSPSITSTKVDRRFSISSKKPDNSDQRNFRSQYYGKINLGVDERKTLEVLLNEDPINLNKLKNFALQFSIPSFDRIVVWKYMLGKNYYCKNWRREIARIVFYGANYGQITNYFFIIVRYTQNNFL